jgi:uncharacterized protein (TIGR02302 family)
VQQAETATALKGASRPIRMTLAGLWAERLVRAFWPLWSLLIAALAALAFDVQNRMALEAFWFGAVAVLLGLGWALVWGQRQFRLPTRAEALARVDARLPGQPIAALMDQPALGKDDPTGRALWQAHLRRMAVQAKAARPVAPDLKLAARDPYALRYVALLAFTMALMFGSLWQAASVTGLMPGGASVAATGPAWEGWAEPPGHTGKPALYLADQTGPDLSLPVGTRLRLRFYGDPGSLILAETVSGRTDVPPASANAQDFLVAQSGKLAIEGQSGREWTVAAVPDLPPTITLIGPVTREPDGEFGVRFSARDDYGVTRGEVVLALDPSKLDRRFGLVLDPEPEALAPVTLDLPMPMKRDRTEIDQQLKDDLSQSLLANMPVTLTLSVKDAAGQTGTAPVISAELPGRRFFDPLAKSLIEMRRDLMWNRANAPRVTDILQAVTWAPEGLRPGNRAYLRLRVLIRNLDDAGAALTPEDRDAAVEELWKIALLVEEGDLASALERLRRAQDRLSEAIRGGASPEELDKLMDEMRQAMNDYIQQQAEQNGPMSPEEQQAQNGQMMSQDQLQAMLDRLDQLMKEGRTAEAQELMEQLRQLMENMRVTQGGPGGQGQGSPGQQAMKDLGQALKDQQGLADDSFKGLQNQGGEGTGQDGQSLAERQQALRDKLDQLQRQGALPGKGNPEGEAGQQQLDRAGEAMDKAEEALRNGDLGSALDKQAEAMDALRQGMRDFGEAMAQNDPQGNQGNSATADAGDPQTGVDPLGRQLGTEGRMGSDANLLQGPDVYRRAQDLLDEIRKRAGEQTRPAEERGYLKRLLDLF